LFETNKQRQKEGRIKTRLNKKEMTERRGTHGRRNEDKKR
jgi:hypothetical protein